MEKKRGREGEKKSMKDHFKISERDSIRELNRKQRQGRGEVAPVVDKIREQIRTGVGKELLGVCI